MSLGFSLIHHIQRIIITKRKEAISTWKTITIHDTNKTYFHKIPQNKTFTTEKNRILYITLFNTFSNKLLWPFHQFFTDS